MKTLNSPAFLRTVIAIGLPLAAIATLILAITYVQDQQLVRRGAYEPQEYIVRDAALRVQAAGALPTSGFAGAIPIESDPAAYLVFFDATGKAIAGTGVLHGAAPTLPAGVLAVAQQKGINRLTWQPEPGVRQAIVIVPAGGGYVLSGRSLAYAEEEIKALGERTLVGWLVTMAGIILVAFASAWLLRKREGE